MRIIQTEGQQINALIGQIAREIAAGLKNKKTVRWTTWDSFAGRQVDHERHQTDEDIVHQVLSGYIVHDIYAGDETRADEIAANGLPAVNGESKDKDSPL
jgi:hypothetical protein